MPEVVSAASFSSLLASVLAILLTVTVSASLLGFAAERALPRRRIFAVPLADGQIGLELVGNVVFVAITTLTVSAALHARVIRFGPASTGRSAATFAVMFVAFQAFYWFLHRAMHTKPLLFIHRWHHRSRVTTPLTGQSMSAGEALGWMVGYVGVPVVLSRVAPLGFSGWAAYLACNAFVNVFGHSNVELTTKATATRTGSLFGNAFVYHSLHHARWTVNYSFQGAAMDRLFGTESPDWEELYARVDSGQPLTSLAERGAAGRKRRAD